MGCHKMRSPGGLSESGSGQSEALRGELSGRGAPGQGSAEAYLEPTPLSCALDKGCERAFDCPSRTEPSRCGGRVVNIGVFVEALEVVPLDDLGPLAQDPMVEESREHVVESERTAAATPAR